MGLLRRQRIAGARSGADRRAAKLDTDAFLFVNYPGYGGLCSGKPSPQSIRENVKESVLAAAKLVKIGPANCPTASACSGTRWAAQRR